VHGRSSEILPGALFVEHLGVFACVVETIMIFALGFLAATLIALLIIPAINSRAERLARRRAVALFPMSVSELAAEKDHLRAEFAVLQRRIERKAEEAQAVKHQAMEELGRRAVRIEALETDAVERDGLIARLQADLAEIRARLAATEEDLAATRASLAGARDTLVAVEHAHRKTLDELAATRIELERTNVALAGTRSEFALAADRLSAREAEFSDLDQRHNASLSDIDTKRITISDLETRLATQTARGNELQRALGEHRNELEEERQRLAELAKSLLAEQERGLVLKSRIRELEGERDAKSTEAARLTARLEEVTGKSEILVTSVEEREQSLDAAEKTLEEARSRSATPDEAGSIVEPRLSEEIRAENAELRRRIAEVADEVIRVAGHQPPEAKGHRKAAG
jgi:chromosome segregation ATPase